MVEGMDSKLMDSKERCAPIPVLHQASQLASLLHGNDMQPSKMRTLPAHFESKQKTNTVGSHCIMHSDKESTTLCWKSTALSEMSTAAAPRQQLQ